MFDTILDCSNGNIASHALKGFGLLIITGGLAALGVNSIKNGDNLGGAIALGGAAVSGTMSANEIGQMSDSIKTKRALGNVDGEGIFSEFEKGFLEGFTQGTAELS